MSLVWNHAPCRSMVFSRRAVHLSSRSLPKGCYYSASFRQTYAKLVDSAPNTYPNLSTSGFPGNATENSDSIQQGSKRTRIRGIVHDDGFPSVDVGGMLQFPPRSNQTVYPLARFVEPSERKLINEPKQNGAGDVSFYGSHELSQSDQLSTSRKAASEQSAYFQPTPTEFLIDTLQNIALSSNDPKIQNWTVTGGNRRVPIMASLSLRQRFKYKRSHRVSLQEIVADYIQFVDPVLQKRGQAVLNNPPVASEFEYVMRSMLRQDYVQYLAARQYDVTDVMTWAWVLKSNTLYEASLRMILLETDRITTKNQKSLRIPAFIPLLFLKQNLDLRTFRLLLIYSLHLISGLPIAPLGSSLDAVPNDTGFNGANGCTVVKPLVDPNMCVTYVVRLLYHARQLWPAAQLTIARAFAFYLSTLDTKGNDSTVATNRIVQFMVKKFNTCLRLLSLPCKTSPFVSISIQQEAQFELLKAMANHKPVLPVTRRGYQGLVAVQLAHKKTSAERQSAGLKAPSWPPWKEDKLGIDVQRGVEGMKSRAIRVMSQMKEAGYAHSRWEEVSSILAGWDTDNSPTIQTRSLIRRPETLHGPAGRVNHPAIWEARIRATRTVREAWACFLAYEDQGLPPHSTIYAAMAEKIMFRRQAMRKNFDQNSLALPGDGLEVFPEPPSLRDWLYTSTEPPTLNDLVQRMISQGIRPRGRFLALLLQNAPTLRSGLEYLNSSDLADHQVRSLCMVKGANSDFDVQSQKDLDELPDYLFSAFLHFLCNFSSTTESALVRGELNTADVFPIVTGNWAKVPVETTTLLASPVSLRKDKPSRRPRTLTHAIKLLRTRNSRFPRGWIQLLSALNTKRILGTSSNIISKETQMILAWHEILEVLEWINNRDIELGFDGFNILCSSFSKAVTAGARSPGAVEQALKLVNISAERKVVHFAFDSPSFESMVRNGLNTLKIHFDRLVILDPKTKNSLFEPIKTSFESGTDSQVTLPALLRVPSPAVLHAFVRTLGLAEDSDGILSLLRWMSEHAATLKDTSDEYLNGDRMIRRTIIAIRMFLEGHWKRQFWGQTHESVFASQVTPNSGNDVPTFSDPDLQSAYDIVTATTVWGPWPSDEEVFDYVTHGMGWDVRAESTI